MYPSALSFHFSNISEISLGMKNMSAFAARLRLARHLRVSLPSFPCSSSQAASMQSNSKLWFSTDSFGNNANADEKNGEEVGEYEDLLGDKVKELKPQGVDPSKGWLSRGVHKAIICGRVGQPPVQKILRNGRSLTIFTVGTGGMFDQRTAFEKGVSRPAQWHRIAVHNEALETYAVQKIVKNSSVYVEGDIETRVYNDNINGEVKYIAEICVRRDGRIRLIKDGEKNASDISFDDLREGLF